MSHPPEFGSLLDRDSFRAAVFERDDHRCVACGISGVRLDAHHVLERRLWDDGGYYPDNGASLCSGCHLDAERTILSCADIRTSAKIGRILLPEHFYDEFEYDKWGNIVHPDGTRTAGELFHDESVQKVLGPLVALGVFRKYVKYPRTFHLPGSLGVTSDDRMLGSVAAFSGKEVVVTEKMDGENTSLYPDHMHARSLDEEHHESRGWVKRLHAGLRADLPLGWRVCGENLYAKHSLKYEDLESYFLAFSIWDDRNACLSWDETVGYSQILGLSLVPVMYRGAWHPGLVTDMLSKLDLEKQEGFVVRIADSFPYASFRKVVAKWVRPKHVETTHGWKRGPVIRNGLKKVGA